MGAKKSIGTLLIAFGILGLTAGVFGIFEEKAIMGINPWAYAILGFIFFTSGVGVMKSIEPKEGQA